MGSYIYPYARGVYPLFFLGRYMKRPRFHISAASSHIGKPSPHCLDALDIWICPVRGRDGEDSYIQSS
jgi:hypothetical protein